MNALLRQTADPQRRRFEEDLSARLEVLFRRCPALCGFTVQIENPMPAHVTCNSAQTQEEAQELISEIAEMLLDLVDECPEGAELLHGRTFARIVH